MIFYNQLKNIILSLSVEEQSYKTTTKFLLTFSPMYYIDSLPNVVFHNMSKDIIDLQSEALKNEVTIP